MAKHYHFEQRSPEWYEARLGIPTASEMDRIITPKTCKPSIQQEAYMNRLLAEWYLNEPLEAEFDNSYMEHGREFEDEAVAAFEFQTGLETTTVGFITLDDGTAGASPDRLVDSLGSLEIKCPKANTHIAYMRTVAVDREYRVQNQAQMWIGELDKSWVVSYHPRLPPVILEVPRDEKFIQLLSGAVRTFTDHMLECREELVKRFGPPVRAIQQEKVAHLDPRMAVTQDDLDWWIKKLTAKEGTGNAANAN